jgi:hypothetical protein
MKWGKSGIGLRLCLAGLVFCFLCLSSWSLSAQSSTLPGSLPDWLKLPQIQTPPENDQRPLVLRLADSVESWNRWSIEVDNWYKTLVITVQATLSSSDKHEADLIAENDALKLENSLLKGQIRSQIEVGLLSGGGGLVGGFAIGFLAGSSIKK